MATNQPRRPRRAKENLDEELIRLPVVRACIEKWNRGREVHGEEFEDNPVVALFGELVDGINYCDQAQMQGVDLGFVRADLLEMAEQVQEVWRGGRQ